MTDLSRVGAIEDDGRSGKSPVEPEGWWIEAQQEIHKSKAVPEQ